MKRPSLTANRGRTAAAVVELVIVIPVLVGVTLGCIDFGRVMAVSDVVSNAAREGAKHGATHGFTVDTKPAWQTRIEQRVTEEMQAISDYDANRLATTIATDESDPDAVQVSVTVSYRFTMETDWPGLPNDFAVRRQVTMIQFR